MQCGDDALCIEMTTLCHGFSPSTDFLQENSFPSQICIEQWMFPLPYRTEEPVQTH